MQILTLWLSRPVSKFHLSRYRPQYLIKETECGSGRLSFRTMTTLCLLLAISPQSFPPRTRGPHQEVRGGEGSAGPERWMGSRCEEERHVGCAWTVVAGETCIEWRLLYKYVRSLLTPAFMGLASWSYLPRLAIRLEFTYLYNT
jgi:hypothetical protein